MAVFGINWMYRIGGGMPDWKTYPEGDSETWNAINVGLQPVIYDISEDGLVACATDMVAAIGLADMDATGTSDTDIHVMLITPLDVFSASVSTDGATTTSALDTLGLNYGLIKSTQTGHTDKWTVNINETSNSAVTIIGNHDDDAWASTDGRVLFRFMNKVAEDGSQA